MYALVPNTGARYTARIKAKAVEMTVAVPGCRRMRSSWDRGRLRERRASNGSDAAAREPAWPASGHALQTSKRSSIVVLLVAPAPRPESSAFKVTERLPATNDGRSDFSIRSSTCAGQTADVCDRRQREPQMNADLPASTEGRPGPERPHFAACPPGASSSGGRKMSVAEPHRSSVIAAAASAWWENPAQLQGCLSLSAGDELMEILFRGVARLQFAQQQLEDPGAFTPATAVISRATRSCRSGSRPSLRRTATSSL